MRFLLVLFALLSGLSLPEVANATTRTEVAGCAAVASVSAAAPTACVVAAARVMAARPVFDPAQGCCLHRRGLSVWRRACRIVRTARGNEPRLRAALRALS
jgi:hypothetical protein